MMPEITRQGEQIGEESVEWLENKFKFKFPADYREFALRNNGGRPEPNCFLVNGRVEGIQRFLSLVTEDLEDMVLENYFEIYKKDNGDRIPAELVPIGHDSGGNLICIAVKGEKTGAIYFWDGDYEGEPEAAKLVADSFTEFLEGLKDL